MADGNNGGYDSSSGPRKPVLHLGPSRRFTLADLAAIATGTAHLELEEPALDALPVLPPNAAPAPPFSSPPSSDGEGELLTIPETRAVIVARLASLIQGRATVSRQTLEILGSLLNDPSSSLPAFRKSHEADNLLSVLHHHLPPSSLPLTLSEMQALRTGTFAHTGPAGLHAYALTNLLSEADLIAATTCEVMHACVEPFQALHFDMHRPHRGQVTSAANLRLLLEGSTLVKPALGGKGGGGGGRLGGGGTEGGGMDPEAVRCIPQVGWKGGREGGKEGGREGGQKSRREGDGRLPKD